MKVLVTGATGYIGGRLTPELLAKGFIENALLLRQILVFLLKYFT
jgi:uncharacterized protein YbjT (DUF2867 family)